MSALAHLDEAEHNTTNNAFAAYATSSLKIKNSPVSSDMDTLCTESTGTQNVLNLHVPYPYVAELDSLKYSISDSESWESLGCSLNVDTYQSTSEQRTPQKLQNNNMSKENSSAMSLFSLGSSKANSTTDSLYRGLNEFAFDAASTIVRGKYLEAMAEKRARLNKLESFLSESSTTSSVWDTKPKALAPPMPAFVFDPVDLAYHINHQDGAKPMVVEPEFSSEEGLFPVFAEAKPQQVLVGYKRSNKKT